MKLKYILFLLFLFSSTFSAQSPDKILKQAEKALCGTKNLQLIQSLQEKGSILRVKDGASGQFLMQTSQPNLVNASARVFLIKGMSMNQVVKTYNYQRFKTEVTDTKIDEIKKP